MDIRDFRHAVNPERSDDTPIYEQLANFIRMQIRAGRFQPGDKMIPENDLCSALNISRTTVRQAMELLVAEGLIVRYRRKGSFVADAKLKRSINNLYNFTENMKELHAIPSSIVLHQEVVTPSEEIANILQLQDTSEQIFYLERVRCADGSPVLIEQTSIPYYLCPGIESYDFSSTSLYNVLREQYSLDLYHATETISAVLIQEPQAHFLQCADGEPGYRITRVSHLDNGFLYEFTSSITRADKCEFQMELYKSTPGKNSIPANIHRTVTL